MTRNIALAFLFTLASVVVLFAVWFGELGRLPEATSHAVATQREFGQRNFEQYCSRCHGLAAEGALGPSLADLFQRKGPGSPAFDQPGTGIKAKFGTLRNYVESTISSGVRDTPMPAWSIQFGGPMRQDQVKAVAEYVMSLQGADKSGSLTADAREAASRWATQQAELAAPVGTAGPSPTPAPGDAARGEQVFTSTTCTGCHSTGTDKKVGPGLAGLFSAGGPSGAPYGNKLANGETISDQSVHDWITNGGTGQIGTMPPKGGASLTDQDILDLVAYLKTL
jgi:mono/diheme cytochrome c family protein